MGRQAAAAQGRARSGGITSAVTAAMCFVRAPPQVPPRACRPAASGFAHREVSLRSCSVAGVASKHYFQRHLARHASTALIPANRIAQSKLALLNRSAPLPASRCCGVLRTAAAPATGQRRGGRFPPRRAGGGEPAGGARLDRIQVETDHGVSVEALETYAGVVRVDPFFAKIIASRRAGCV